MDPMLTTGSFFTCTYAVVNRYLYYIYTHFLGSTVARVTLDNEVLSTLLGKVTEITSPEVITGTNVITVTPLSTAMLSYVWCSGCCKVSTLIRHSGMV